MKRDLRLLIKRDEIDRKNYIVEIEQQNIEGDFPGNGMAFENCLDHIEGEISYSHISPKQYDEYLNDIKEECKGNTWKYLWHVQRLYDGNFLSAKAREYNLDLLKQSQEFWFRWVRSIPYPGIQGYCLSYAPSLDCFIDFLKFLVTANWEEVSGRENNVEQEQILIVLLIQTFILQMTSIASNMNLDNRIYAAVNKWDIEKWEKEESSTYIRDFIQALLEIPPEVLYPVIYAMLSDEWIVEKKVLRDIYRKRFRDAFLGIFAERYNKELLDIIKSNSWEESKAALYHRLCLYYYWVKSSDELCLETNREIQNILWTDWRKLIHSDSYVVSNLYGMEDGFWFLWLSGWLMSKDENIQNRYYELRSDTRKRLDGWNYKYEKSRRDSDVSYCILTVAAMAAEWKVMQGEDRWEAAGFYWFIFEEASILTRNDIYIDDVMEKSLMQIWSRMVLLADNNPLIERWEVIWKFICNINCFAQRVNVMDILFYNMEKKELHWRLDDRLRSNLLCMLEAEKGILNKEKISDTVYFERYYLNEFNALQRCFKYLNEKD